MRKRGGVNWLPSLRRSYSASIRLSCLLLRDQRTEDLKALCPLKGRECNSAEAFLLLARLTRTEELRAASLPANLHSTFDLPCIIEFRSAIEFSRSGRYLHLIPRRIRQTNE